MALINCAECGKELSDKAEACPHCGVKIKKSANTAAADGMGCLVVLALLVLIAYTWASFDKAKPKPTEDEVAATPECRADLICLRSTIKSGAMVDCADAIQRQAKWDYQWPDGSGYKAFPSFVWADTNHNQVALGGNSLKLQNGFGAWQRVSYICYVDVATRRVVNVEIVQ